MSVGAHPTGSPDHPTLRGHDRVPDAAAQSVANRRLARVRLVDVRRIDEIHAQLYGPAEHRASRLGVSETVRPEPYSMDFAIPESYSARPRR